jgi:hypothetical protein
MELPYCVCCHSPSSSFCAALESILFNIKKHTHTVCVTK